MAGNEKAVVLSAAAADRVLLLKEELRSTATALIKHLQQQQENKIHKATHSVCIPTKHL